MQVTQCPAKHRSYNFIPQHGSVRSTQIYTRRRSQSSRCSTCDASLGHCLRCAVNAGRMQAEGLRCVARPVNASLLGECKPKACFASLGQSLRRSGNKGRRLKVCRSLAFAHYRQRSKTLHDVSTYVT